MKYIRDLAAVALFAALAFAIACAPASAQTVITLPQYVDQGAAKDFGNGPIQLKVVQGNALFVTSQGFGTVSSATGTLITLSATPTNLPCVNSLIATNTTMNCAIGGSGITSGTLIGSFTASTGTGTGGGPVIGVTNLQSALLSAGNQLGWGSACPATPPAPVLPLQSSQPYGDPPFYTTARVCGYSINSPGAMVLPFPIGAH